MSRVQRYGAIGSSAAFGVAVVAPWMAKWPYLGIVVLALLAVSVWALLTMRRAMKDVELRAHLPNRYGETVTIDLDQLEPDEEATARPGPCGARGLAAPRLAEDDEWSQTPDEEAT